LISGFVFIFLIAILIFCLLFSQVFDFIYFFFRLGFCLIFGLFCFSLFFIPIMILCYVQSNIYDFGSNIEIEKGNTGNFSIGTVCCASIGIILMIIISIFV
jgi:hypothetical protein